MTGSRTGLGQVGGWVARGLGLLAMLVLLAPMAAGAALLAEPDSRAVREVVEAQLDAFAAGDAERAFSYSSPSVRAQFGDAGSFLDMVRGGYPMLVGPAAVSFLQAQADNGSEPDLMTVRQAVQLRDGDGRLWIATYELERQAGAGWRVSGCVVQADSTTTWT